VEIVSIPWPHLDLHLAGLHDGGLFYWCGRRVSQGCCSPALSAPLPTEAAPSTSESRRSLRSRKNGDPAAADAPGSCATSSESRCASPPPLHPARSGAAARIPMVRLLASPTISNSKWSNLSPSVSTASFWYRGGGPVMASYGARHTLFGTDTPANSWPCFQSGVRPPWIGRRGPGDRFKAAENNSMKRRGSRIVGRGLSDCLSYFVFYSCSPCKLVGLLGGWGRKPAWSVLLAVKVRREKR